MTFWRLTDGRRGHENQTSGLCEALLRRRPSIAVHDISCEGAWWRSFPETAAKLPPPDVILGAGHRTHTPLLLAKRRFGGKTLVLMKPSLPLRCFDFAMVPRHDLATHHSNRVMITTGAINRIQPSGGSKEDLGVILVGGPSKIFRWQENLPEQIRRVCEAQSRLHWKITTSRRTPPKALQSFESLASIAEIIPAENTDEDWVPRHLEKAQCVWVTEDSVSMMFEALTSGASVGLFTMPCRHPKHRVAREIHRLEAESMLTRFDPESDLIPRKPPMQLWEADRCARLLLEKIE